MPHYLILIFWRVVPRQMSRYSMYAVCQFFASFGSCFHWTSYQSVHFVMKEVRKMCLGWILLNDETEFCFWVFTHEFLVVMTKYAMILFWTGLPPLFFTQLPFPDIFLEFLSLLINFKSSSLCFATYLMRIVLSMFILLVLI